MFAVGRVVDVAEIVTGHLPPLLTECVILSSVTTGHLAKKGAKIVSALGLLGRSRVSCASSVAGFVFAAAVRLDRSGVNDRRASQARRVARAHMRPRPADASP